MVKKVVATLLAALLLSAASISAAHAYTPRTGPRFNDPSGNAAAQNRSMNHVRQSIQSVPKNGVIRIASYSYDRKDITDALITACRQRHVSVQVVLNDNWTSYQTRRLQRLLGTNINPHWDDACNKRKKPAKPGSEKQPYQDPSFVKVCYQSCRLGAGNQHMKFYLFSQAGAAKNVVMVGSTNLAGYAAGVHFNDLFTQTGRGGMFEGYSKVFRQLAEDRRVAKTYSVLTSGDLVTEFGPKQKSRGARDPIAQRLSKVRCSSGSGKTVIRIMMYAWGKQRGLYLARRVADLSRQGCNVRAILSGASKDVKTALRNGRVGIRSADMNLDGDTSTGFGDTAWDQFTHEKWMALSGSWSGSSQSVVWTGSENWANLSYHNDEVTLKIPRRGTYNAYIAHFNYLWTRHTRAI